MTEIKSFYFTYGTEGHPYSGGWTEVQAPDREKAVAAFRAFHPDRTEGVLNCCDLYTWDQFIKAGMSIHGNFGHRCHETILLWEMEHETERSK